MQLNLFDVKKTKKESVVKKKYDYTKIVATLDKRIDSAQKKADNISTDVLGNWTAKRGREAENRRNNKKELEEYIHCLTQIRNEWIEGDPNPLLKNIRSINDIKIAMYWGYPNPLDGTEVEYFKEKHAKQIKACKRLNITSDNTDEIKTLLKEYCNIELSEEQKKKIELEKAISNIQWRKIPGFFPTPKPLIERMLDYARMFEKKGMNILEPSAGIGDIADAIKELNFDHDITCVEVNYELCNILKLKGYKVQEKDIFQFPINGIESKVFDRIIMNPPFEKGQDVEHITHCYYKLLKDKGILVSVASKSVMSNSQNKYKMFRELVSGHGQFIKLDEGEFKGAFNPTGVSTVLVILYK